MLRLPLTALLLVAVTLAVLPARGSTALGSTVPLSWGDAVRIAGEAWGCEEPANLGGTVAIACAGRNGPIVRFNGPYVAVVSNRPPRVSSTPGQNPSYTYTFDLGSPHGSPNMPYDGETLAPGGNLAFPDLPGLSCSYVSEPRAFTCFLTSAQDCSLGEDPLTCLTGADAVVSVVGGKTLQVSIDRPARSQKVGSGRTWYHWGPPLSLARAVRDGKLVGDALLGLRSARRDIRVNTDESLRRVAGDVRAPVDDLGRVSSDLDEASFEGPDPTVVVDALSDEIFDLSRRLYNDRDLAPGRPLPSSERDRLLAQMDTSIAKTKNALARLDRVVSRTRG